MKKILIIGGTGYIGSALYQHLNEVNMDYALEFNNAPYSVDTVDLEWFGNYVNPDNFVMDYRNLTKEQLAKYDVVVLLAAYSSPAICDNSGRTSVIHNNVNNFADILPKIGPNQKFIYASSVVVYDGKQKEEVTEEQPLIHLPSTNLYDFSKQDCDRIIQMYPEVEFYGLRLATLSGASKNFRSDIMVNAMTNCAILDSEVKLLNPDNYKSILYLGDLVRAIETIINCATNKRGFYNLASFNGVIHEIGEIVADITNSKLNILTSAQMGKLGLPTSVYDISMSTKKFQETFNFKFEGTAASITDEILRVHKDITPTKRLTGIRYV